MEKEIKVAFVGNPNCGKTTLFNAITGSNLKVANWPGVTVEKKEGFVTYEDCHITLVDTPGIYSLSSYTIEEKVTRSCVLNEEIDVIVNIVDASSLERNLYLTLQLLELGKPVVIALNMMDIIKDRGLEIDLHRLPEMLGNVAVVPVSATKRIGIDILLHGVIHHYEEGSTDTIVEYGTVLEDKIKKLEIMLGAYDPKHGSLRWHAIKLLEYDEDVRLEHSIKVETIVDKNYEKYIIQQKYKYIEQIIKEVVFHLKKKIEATEKIDKWLTHPVWGLPIFFGVMICIFFLTFTVGDSLKGIFEVGLSFFSETVNSLLITFRVSPVLISLIIDGIIAGVGGILSFLPNIFILFLAMAFLEDSGYMSRVAYVMDYLMGKIGLSGKAFLPMILGFGCSVPAIMATRALETEKDRRKAMFLTPFMSCSAKLPIYVLFSQMFFPNNAVLVAFSMYLVGFVLGILIALIMHVLQREKENDCLLIELPEYKRPNGNSIRIYVWTKVKDYISKAGTTIFIASIIIWILLNFGMSGKVENPSESFGAMLGMLLVPILKPAGLGMWQIAVALISGISAKEVVVSSFAVLFGVANANSAAGMGAIVCNIQSIDPGFTAVNAYALMIFCLLYVPCAATIAIIRKESNSWSFTGKVVAFQLLFAWSMSVLVYQIGSLLFT